MIDRLIRLLGRWNARLEARNAAKAAQVIDRQYERSEHWRKLKQWRKLKDGKG